MAFLCFRSRSVGGRGAGGRIAIRRRGGGIRRRQQFPLLSGSYKFMELAGKVVSSWCSRMLVALSGGWFVWCPRPKGVQVGSVLGWSKSGAFGRGLGSVSPLALFSTGSSVHGLESNFGKFSVIRSSGTVGRVLRHYRYSLAVRNKTLVRLPSGQLKLFASARMASAGQVGVPLFRPKLFRAGASRRLGRRPSVRGVAMNPVDHPHGGGQGKTSGGRPSCSPWGVYTKGVRTRARRAPSNRFLVTRFLNEIKLERDSGAPESVCSVVSSTADSGRAEVSGLCRESLAFVLN